MNTVEARPYPFPPTPTYSIFSDLDETFYIHNKQERCYSSIQSFEETMHTLALTQGALFGLVTGSSLESVLEKLSIGGYRYAPHFIGCDLGTRLYWVKEDGTLEEDLGFKELLAHFSFDDSLIEQIKRELAHQQIVLTEQTQLGSSPYKKNFYYFKEHDELDKERLMIIRSVAKRHGIHCNINRCNPLAGDPEDAYDVDFIPLHTGKDSIVNYVNQKYRIPYVNSFAFGDSGNDLTMLTAVKHGYLVRNATEESKDAHSKVTPYPYIEGITYILRNQFDL
ncbi:HAD family hydrolase [Pontibacillus halophilus JSM 076056 = DSM 19796]|uniref:HAD family hydrolase n=1 Tax=Pontibacillus halophilus JSM 076056 = DSM 19796 TaxID=1385510 RepID=A0A0A5GLR8_9BACI|nr:HAD-IIB family hydrolase [Pontibacillus halophilus]KGX92095.1 HAD family hydrolase [Pontibacillus halophilus JSM 076056 = DSM 19796]